MRASNSSALTKNIEAKLEKPASAKPTAPVPAEKPKAAAAAGENSEKMEVKDFLESIKLGKYYEKLLMNGIEDIETILELQEDHIEKMGIPLGHKLKLVKKIKEMRIERAGVETPVSTSTKSSIKDGQYDEAEQAR